MRIKSAKFPRALRVNESLLSCKISAFNIKYFKGNLVHQTEVVRVVNVLRKSKIDSLHDVI